MMQAYIERHGGPEVIQWRDVPAPEPGEGEVVVAHRAVGVNFIDTYHRSGLYATPLPSGLGVEGCGVVAAVGRGVDPSLAGQRVAYTLAAPGSYAEQRVVPAERVVRVPRTVDDAEAATVMVRGLTAWYLLRRTCEVGPGTRVLVHAAAGGMGSYLCQWARYLGAQVIGTVGGRAKLQTARDNGCHHVIDYDHEPVAERVRALTDGRGVDVVYDGVGQATFDASLACLRPRGMMVSYGNASGPPAPVAPATLASHGSLFLTRPSLYHYIADRDELQTGAAEVFALLAGGVLRARIHASLPLKEAAEAHRLLEQRQASGSVVLTVGS